MVTVLGGLLLWRASLRFGAVPGFVAHALWCFSPAVLAAGSLATLDAWVTAFVIALTWATARYLESPRWPRGVIVGVCAGLAIACKITALGAAGVAVLVCAWGAARHAAEAGRARTPVAIAVAAVAAGIGALTLWILSASPSDPSAPFRSSPSRPGSRAPCNR